MFRGQADRRKHGGQDIGGTYIEKTTKHRKWGPETDKNRGPEEGTGNEKRKRLTVESVISKTRLRRMAVIIPQHRCVWEDVPAKHGLSVTQSSPVKAREEEEEEERRVRSRV